MYDEIMEQIPKEYYPNKLYSISSSCFAPKSEAKYFACINNRGYLHIYKFTVIKRVIFLERFRFTKQKKPVFIGDYLLAPKDGDIYNKYKALLGV